MQRKPTELPPSSRRGYTLFAKLWGLKEDTPTDLAATLLSALDKILLMVCRSEQKWFPSPYGGAAVFDTVDQAIEGTKKVVAYMSAKGIDVALAITWGRLERVHNVTRWNVAALAINTAARIASYPLIKGRIAVDSKVRDDAESAKSSYAKIFGVKQVGKVKRTRFSFHLILPREYRQKLSQKSRLPKVKWRLRSADIIVFDIERYSEQSLQNQKKLLGKLSECVETAYSDLGEIPKAFGPAGDGGYLVLFSEKYDTASRAWSFAKSLRLDAEKEKIPLRIGIAHGPVAVGKRQRVVGGSIILADRVSSRAPRYGIAVTTSFWESLPEKAKSHWKSHQVPTVPNVLVVKEQAVSPPLRNQSRIINNWNRLDLQGKYVGRRAEFQRINSCLTSARIKLISIVGREGIGKSALASHVLKSLERDSARWAHAFTGFVYLSSLDESLSLERIFLDIGKMLGGKKCEDVLRIWTDGITSPKDKIRLLHEMVVAAKSKSVLLLDKLDDFIKDNRVVDSGIESFLNVFAQRSSGLKIIVTSRVPFDLESHSSSSIYSIELRKGLAIEEGVKFLRGLDPDGTRGLRKAPKILLARAVRVTRGNPRALELLQAVLYSHPNQSLSQLLKNKTLFAEKIIDKLSEDVILGLGKEKRLIVAALSVLREPVPESAIRYMVEPYNLISHVTDTLAQLVRNQVVVHNPATNRYSLHSSERDFSYRILSRSHEGHNDYSTNSLESRAANYYRRFRSPLKAMRFLKDIAPHLKEFQHLVRAGNHHDAAVLLRTVDVDYLLVWGFAEKVIALRKMLNPKLLTKDDLYHQYLILGMAEREVSRFDRALGSFDKALDVARRENKSLLMANVWKEASEAWRLLGKYDEALDNAIRSVKVFERHHEDEKLLTSLIFAGDAYRRIGEFDRAIAYGERAITLTGKLAEAPKRSVANAYWHTGQACRRTGDFAKALLYFKLGFQKAELINDKNGKATALNNIAETYVSSGRFAIGIEYASKALALHRKTHNTHRKALCLLTIGTGQLGMKNFDEASNALIASFKLMKSVGDMHSVGYSATFLARMYREMGDLHLAAYYAKAAVEEFNRLHSRSLNLALAIQAVVSASIHDAKDQLAKELARCAEAYIKEGISFADARAVAQEGLQIAQDRTIVDRLTVVISQVEASVRNVVDIDLSSTNNQLQF